jgi:hypothetical protein
MVDRVRDLRFGAVMMADRMVHSAHEYERALEAWARSSTTAEGAALKAAMDKHRRAERRRSKALERLVWALSRTAVRPAGDACVHCDGVGCRHCGFGGI